MIILLRYEVQSGITDESDRSVTGCSSRGITICYRFFFFQAEDGIRDVAVTGVQTCALPISSAARARRRPREHRDLRAAVGLCGARGRLRARAAEEGHAERLDEARRGERGREIGRASCRERV